MPQHISDWIGHPTSERVFELTPDEIIVDAPLVQSLEAQIDKYIIIAIKDDNVSFNSVLALQELRKTVKQLRNEAI